MNIKFERATPLKNRHMGPGDVALCRTKNDKKYDNLVYLFHMLGSILFYYSYYWQVGKSVSVCTLGATERFARMWLVGDSRLFEVFVEPRR